MTFRCPAESQKPAGHPTPSRSRKPRIGTSPAKARTDWLARWRPALTGHRTPLGHAAQPLVRAVRHPKGGRRSGRCHSPSAIVWNNRVRSSAPSRPKAAWRQMRPPSDTANRQLNRVAHDHFATPGNRTDIPGPRSKNGSVRFDVRARARSTRHAPSAQAFRRAATPTPPLGVRTSTEERHSHGRESLRGGHESAITSQRKASRDFTCCRAPVPAHC